MSVARNKENFTIDLELFHEKTQELFRSAEFLSFLRHCYDIGKSIKWFQRLAILVVRFIDGNRSYLTMQDFRDAKCKMEPDHSIQLIKGLPRWTPMDHSGSSISNILNIIGIAMRELCILIAILALEHHGQYYYTFEMIYDQLQKFSRTHGGSMYAKDRQEILFAFEKLLQTALLRDVGDAFHLGGRNKFNRKQFYVVQSSVDPFQVQHMIRNQQISCPTMLYQWATKAFPL